MKTLPNSVVLVLCLAIALPTDAFLWKDIKKGFETVGKGIAEGAKTIAKPFCHGFTKVGCPITASVGAGAAIAATSGGAAPVAVPAAIALATSCGVVAATNQCDKIGRRKRATGEIEVVNGMIYYPISDDFGEFDDNDDGLIEYEEFAFDFLARWQFQHPEQLRKMFKGADTDGDGMLDENEFFGAPWDFGKYGVKVQKTPVNATPANASD